MKTQEDYDFLIAKAKEDGDKPYMNELKARQALAAGLDEEQLQTMATTARILIEDGDVLSAIYHLMLDVAKLGDKKAMAHCVKSALTCRDYAKWSREAKASAEAESAALIAAVKETELEADPELATADGENL